MKNDLEWLLNRVEILKCSGASDEEISKLLQIGRLKKKFADVEVTDSIDSLGSISQRNIAFIWEAVAAGARGYEEVKEVTGINRKTIFELKKKGYVQIPHKKFATSSEALRVKELFYGGKSDEEIAKELDVSYRTIQSYRLDNGILRERKKYVSSVPSKVEESELVRLAKRGLSQWEIGRRFGVTRERVRQKMNDTIVRDKDGNKVCLHDLWFKSGKFYRNVNNIRERLKKEIISGIVGGVLERKYEEATWAEKKALDYLNSREAVYGFSYSFETLSELFRRYETAKNKGEKLSLEKLGEGIIPISRVGPVLRRVGLPNLNKNQERKVTPPNKKLALKNAAGTALSNSDVAYFVRVPPYVAGQSMTRYGRKSNRISDANFRLDSQIYEASDLGFSVDEIAQLLDTHESTVKASLFNRDYFSDIIIKNLRKIFPNREVDKPYL